MEANHVFFKCFDDVQEGHEELVKLSLSTSTTTLPKPFLSASSSLGQQIPQLPLISNSRKRLLPQSFDDEEDDHEEQLDLSLSVGPVKKPSPLPASTSHQTHSNYINNPQLDPVRARGSTAPGNSSYHQRPKGRRNPFQAPKGGKSEIIPAPYPWATTRRATVYSLENLLTRGIRMISGELECKECQESFTIEYNLEEKFKEVRDFVAAYQYEMHHRAPEAWLSPKLDNCRFCANSLRPVITKKRHINWLFLMLGKMLGCCKLSELKYFCKHTKNHRTGAKDRVLFLTYLGLCKQLDPDGPFDI